MTPEDKAYRETMGMAWVMAVITIAGVLVLWLATNSECNEWPHLCKNVTCKKHINEKVPSSSDDHNPGLVQQRFGQRHE